MVLVKERKIFFFKFKLLNFVKKCAQKYFKPHSNLKFLLEIERWV